MPAPFLNVDAGELEGEPEELYALAHVLNVACGGHAGDEASMLRVVMACRTHGAQLGAHPSYPDRENFGRRALELPPAELLSSIAEQCHALASVARKADVPIRYAKLHGALYHAADRHPELAAASLRGMIEALGWEFTVLGPRGGELARAAAELGLRFAVEGFADRGRRADGTLVPRGEPGALVTDPTRAAAQARALAAEVDTICVHGDTKGAIAIARAVRTALEAGA